MTELNEIRKIRFRGHVETTTTVRSPRIRAYGECKVIGPRQYFDNEFIPTRFIYKGDGRVTPRHHTLGFIAMRSAPSGYPPRTSPALVILLRCADLKTLKEKSKRRGKS